jgi:hypothetical protein
MQVLRSLVVATNDGRKIVARRTMTPRLPNTHDCSERKLQPGRDIMSTLSKLHQSAAEHHEHAARHYREAAKLQEAKDILAAADQAHLAHDHQVHAARFAAEAAKEYAARRGK